MLSKLLRNSEPSIPLTAYYSDRNLYLSWYRCRLTLSTAHISIKEAV